MFLKKNVSYPEIIFFSFTSYSKIGGTNIVGAVSAVTSCVDCIVGRYRQSKAADGVTSTDPKTCVDCPAGSSSEAGSAKW